jgi:hypothetical protein
MRRFDGITGFRIDMSLSGEFNGSSVRQFHTILATIEPERLLNQRLWDGRRLRAYIDSESKTHAEALQAERIDLIDGIVLDKPIQIDPSRFSNRITVYEPADGWVIKRLQVGNDLE